MSEEGFQISEKQKAGTISRSNLSWDQEYASGSAMRESANLSHLESRYRKGEPAHWLGGRSREHQSSSRDRKSRFYCHPFSDIENRFPSVRNIASVTFLTRT